MSGLSIVLGAAFAAASLSADTSPAPPVVVVVELECDVPDACVNLAFAISIATDVFDRADVVLLWKRPVEATNARRLQVRLLPASAMRTRYEDGVFGVAPSPGDGTRGTLAFVFVDRVRAFAAEHRVSAAHVLGGAIAHELGHLLLPPYAHRDNSVMRATWRPAQFPPYVPGITGFAPDQARLLRRRAAPPIP